MNLLLTTPPETSEKIVRTNLLGTIFVTQIFAPLLIKSGGGSITNFSTIAVALTLPGESAYIASKAGVEAFSKVSAKELSSFGIRVNCVAPGPIETNLIAGVDGQKIQKIVGEQIQKEIKTIHDVAKVVWLVAGHPDAESITGEVIHVGGV